MRENINKDILDNLILMKCESYVFICEDQTGMQIRDTTKNADDFCFNIFNLILQDQFNSQNGNFKQIIQSLKDEVKRNKFQSEEVIKYPYQNGVLTNYKSSINNVEGFKIEATLQRIISMIKKDNQIFHYVLFINVNGKVISLVSSEDKDIQLIYVYLAKGCTKFGLRINRLLELCEQTAQNLGPSVITIYRGDKAALGNDYLLAKLPMKNYYGLDKSIKSLSLQIEIERKFKQILRKHNSSWYWCFLTNGNTGYILLPKVEGNYDQITHNLYQATSLSSELASTKISSFLNSLNKQINICRDNNYFRYVKPDTTSMNVNRYMPSTLAKFRKTSLSTFEIFNKNNLSWIAFVESKKRINTFTNLVGIDKISNIFCDSIMASLPWNANMRSLLLYWPQTYKKLSLK